jgi:hypothetical protein
MATAVKPTLAGHTVITPDLAKPKVGQPTVICFFGADHTVMLSLATVLAIGPVDPVTEEPTLSLVYANDPADPQKLGTVRWYEGFTRATGVQHYSHPDARDGKLSVAWGGDGDIEIDAVPSIPQPEGTGVENPIFARQELDTPPSTAAVQAEALAAQRGNAPEGSHTSPLTSEAGATHDAVVPAADPAQAPASQTGAVPAQGIPVGDVATSQEPAV